MAEREANLPVDFFQLGPQDEQLTSPELATLSLFEGLKKVPSFYKFPGSTVLRKCVPGQVMCRQGEAGASAYYILSSQDIIDLRRLQLTYVDALLQAGDSTPEVPARLESFDQSKLQALRSEWQREVDAFTDRKNEIDLACEQAPDEATRDAERERLGTVGKVKLLTSPDSGRPRRGLLHRLAAWLSKPHKAEAEPAFIPIDGMVALDARTLEAPLIERDVFGEMSCLNRAPRSATVIAEQDCYMLEFLRNVLDMLYKDPHYKQKTDKIYRQRVLDKQVQQMSVFKHLSDSEYQQLKPKLELVEFDAGRVIFDEFEESDCLYLIRSGLVKVVKHASALLSAPEASRISWTHLASELLAGQQRPQSPAGKVWSKLRPEPQALLGQVASGATLTPAQQQLIVAELNRFIRAGELSTAFGDTRTALLANLELRVFDQLVTTFPEKVKAWSELRVRLFHRTLLEVVCPQGLPRWERRTPRTLNYLSKGEILGEIGLLTDEPRSASCIAFDQRDRGHEQSKQDLEASPSRVELVRLKREDLAAVSATFRRSLEAAKEKRVANLKENQRVQAAAVRTLQSQTVEFEQLGLVQGQELMLIDLEKCTRCGACVEACVDAHADGRNRLYLDGPRFDKYLVPITCRSCLDPVCMIGCPVGAIYRGDNGEIRIRNHCIGCSLCADQCPYGSIHMSDREHTPTTSGGLFQLEKDVVLKEFTQRAVVCDLCQSHSSQQPSCVYACPHDAAMRVDALAFFGVTD